MHSQSPTNTLMRVLVHMHYFMQLVSSLARLCFTLLLDASPEYSMPTSAGKQLIER
jgi:hypothetical protein